MRVCLPSSAAESECNGLLSDYFTTGSVLLFRLLPLDERLLINCYNPRKFSYFV